jgi:hypothetical protein
MFQDIELSRDVMSAYMQHMNAAKESSSSHPNSINPAISSSLATTSSKPLQYKPEGLGLNGTHTEVGTIDLPVSSISKRYSSVEFQAQVLFLKPLLFIVLSRLSSWLDTHNWILAHSITL